MATLAHDTSVRRQTSGLGFAVTSAASFGLAGALGAGLMGAGWSASAAVAVRMLIGAAVLVVPAAVSLRGRWWLLRRHARALVAYGVIAVAGCQLGYFNAVRHLPVGVALLIEYASPVAVVAWLWLRRGQRPGRATVAGSLVAAIGLVLVLDVLSGAALSVPGISWAVLAMVCVSFYFVVSADADALPPLVLACGGLLVGACTLLVLGVVGLQPLHATTDDVRLSGADVPFWLPALGLGVITAAVSYVTGIAATRHLGSRLASYLGLLEVLFAMAFAALLLAQHPSVAQLLGAALVVGGVLVVRAGEPGVPVGDPEAAVGASGLR